MLITLTAAALLLSAADQDGVISTAPRGQAVLPTSEAVEIQAASPSTTVGSAAPHGLTTADQISNWIGQGRAERAASDRPWVSIPDDTGPRKPRGEISAGIGTGGYRDFSAAVELPVGESGTLNLSVRQSKNDPYAYDPYYDRLGAWGGWRHSYSPLSSWYEPEVWPLGARSGWMRERLSGERTGGKSTSVSLGFDSRH